MHRPPYNSRCQHSPHNKAIKTGSVAVVIPMTGERGETESSVMCAKPVGMRHARMSVAVMQDSLGPAYGADHLTTSHPMRQLRSRKTSRRGSDVLGTKQLLRLQIPHRRNSHRKLCGLRDTGMDINWPSSHRRLLYYSGKTAEVSLHPGYTIATASSLS